MFTTGFKFFFGLAIGLTGAAVVYGYDSGGNHVGPISLGWKGGVGDQFGYGMLVVLALAALFVAIMIVSYRDADPAAQAHLQGVDAVPTGAPVAGSFWPVVGAFGIGTTAVGLVLHPVVFGLGLIILVLSLFEWTMDAWADRASGDPVANKQLRSRIMGPVEIPVAGLLIVGIAVLASSRILLSVSQLGAVIVAGVLATIILLGAAVYVHRPGSGRQIVAGLALVGALALIVGGVLAAVNGERDFEHHSDDETHEESSESGESE